MYANKLGRFTTTDPLYIEFNRRGSPQGWNLFSYSRNNPINITDPNGLDVKVNCKTDKDKISDCETQTSNNLNGRKDKQFDVEVKNGRFQVVGKVDISKLSKSELKLYSAITNTFSHSTLNVELSSDAITFGRFDGVGENSVDLADLGKLNKVNSNLAGEVIAHEVLEGYESSIALLPDRPGNLTSDQLRDVYLDAHKRADEGFGQATLNVSIPKGTENFKVSSKDATLNYGRLGVSLTVTKQFNNKEGKNTPIANQSIVEMGFENIRGSITKVSSKPK